MTRRSLLFLFVVLICNAQAQHPAGTRAPRPADCPPAWKVLLGEYYDKDTLLVYEDGGRLLLRASSGETAPLVASTGRVFGWQPMSTTVSVPVTFSGPDQSRPNGLTFRGRPYVRRVFDGEDGKTFHIAPLFAMDELQRRARAASPPVEQGEFFATDLVELRSLDSTIHYDIRYATTNNFMQQQFYSRPRAYLQRPAAEAAVRAHRWLRALGYGLLIHDAYRPWPVTKMFWDATPNEQKLFVANPAQGSRHNRGCATDVSLYDLKTGQPVDMVSGYDEFSQRAFPFYAGGTSLERWHRQLLRTAFEQEGFRVYEWEWWHFDFQGWQKYRIGAKTFEELGQ